MVRGLVMAVFSVVVLAAIALVLVGPRKVEGILPPAVVGLVGDARALVGLGGTDARSGNRPEDFLDIDETGFTAVGPIAARAGNQPVFIKEVISGYSTRGSTGMPAEITTLRPIMGCMPTPPISGSVVGHVTAGRSDLPLALLTYNDTHLATAVQRFVDAYRKTGAATDIDLGALTYQSYDVAVTEINAPVYLVLENGTGNRIWNIHLAPGARIERVVLLGGQQAGVANLDPVVPVEVILSDGLAACGIAPGYGLAAGNALIQSLQSGAMSAAEAEAGLLEIGIRASAYDRWFLDSFGTGAEASRAGFDRGTISVVGPVPLEAEPKAVYVQIAGAKLRMTKDKFFEIRGQVGEGEDFASRVRAIATTFAFGDLANLRQGVEF